MYKKRAVIVFAVICTIVLKILLLLLPYVAAWWRPVIRAELSDIKRKKEHYKTSTCKMGLHCLFVTKPFSLFLVLRCFQLIIIRCFSLWVVSECGFPKRKMTRGTKKRLLFIFLPIFRIGYFTAAQANYSRRLPFKWSHFKISFNIMLEAKAKTAVYRETTNSK